MSFNQKAPNCEQSLLKHLLNQEKKPRLPAALNYCIPFRC